MTKAMAMDAFISCVRIPPEDADGLSQIRPVTPLR